ncbi:hypothetical protein [Pseudokordiimonas caeni]|uniref:hypothetical protein n=1 Tax=Pseudokordiimonas caeni TaxID=2997908 RepID=UPI002811E4BF|nr:hypothetical protein [Pseudokordiimonas caeni]
MTTIGSQPFDIAAFQARGIQVSNKPLPEETIKLFTPDPATNAGVGGAGDIKLDKFKQAVKDYTEPDPEEEELRRGRAYDDADLNARAKTHFEAQVQGQGYAVAAASKA